MCWQCDHPGSSYEDYLEHLRDLMKCQGWIIQGVGGDRIPPPWAYTVGLTEFGAPELVVTGMREVPFAVLLGSYFVMRCVLLGTLENPETRYSLELYPIIIVAAASVTAPRRTSPSDTA